MSRRLLPCGPRAWLVELDGEDVVAVAEAVGRAARPDVVEVVPAARTVLVQLTATADREAVATWLTDLPTGGGAAVGKPRTAIEIPVVYDGADLAAVAASCGVSTDEVVQRHSAVTYECAFCGFAPGFAYLSGLDRALHLPRRPTPRTRVPAGAVAIAAEFSAVYPSASPGGWHLLGTTSAELWNPDRTAPALITPGSTVRFVEVPPDSILP